MAKYISNRNGGKTDEQGHYRFHVNAWDGNILNDGLKVKQNSPLGMSVLIEPGDVKIDYSTYGYTGWNDADEAVTIATADGSNPRIDRIVAYVDRVMTPSPSNSNNPGMLKFMSVAGTPAGSPSPVSDAAVNTAVSNNPWCELAQVRVNAGVSTITNGNITDKRVFATPKIPDGAVTPAKLSTSPSNFGLQEIARTTLSSAGDTITVNSIPVRNHIKILIGYIASGGTADTSFRINNLSSAIYRMTYNVSPAISTGIDTGAVTSLPVESGVVASGVKGYCVIDMWNASGGRRIGNMVTVSDTTSVLAWLRGSFIIDTSSQMTRFDLTNAGTGDFGVGSEVIVLGTN